MFNVPDNVNPLADFTLSGMGDSNPQPFRPDRNALANCANPRYEHCALASAKGRSAYG